MTLITETMLRAMWKRGIPAPFPLATDDRLTPAAADFLKGRGIPVKPHGKTESPADSGNIEKADDMFTIPSGVSNRHVHLSKEHVEQLFGTGYELTPFRNLSQPGQFAANEQITLLGPKGMISHVRILGPARGASQVEISRTDGFQLGIHPPIRLSGHVEGTPGITLIGPKGCVTLEQGVIIAKCHVHLSGEEAERMGISQHDSLVLQTTGDRPIIFPDVAVRISPNYRLDFHIDQDEANAANVRTGDHVRIIGKNGRMGSLAR
ncbi:MAG: phosphate propanoyltransferase [Clostridia bacterium]